MKNILIVVAHSDDETLGMGATIARHTANGDTVNVMFMTDGVSSRSNSTNSACKERYLAAQKAMKILGVTNLHFFDFPDNSMDTVPLIQLVKAVESVIDHRNPDTIYTHYAYDLNIDHQLTHSAVMTACRPQRNSTVHTILSFEVLSSTEWSSPSTPTFNPQYFVNSSHFWKKKQQALQCYAQELRDFPHSRSLPCIEALGTLRGATNGFEKAEAFYIERILIS